MRRIGSIDAFITAIVSIAGLIASLSPRIAYAGLVRVESNSVFSSYRGEDLAMKTPLMEFFEAHYNDNQKKLRLSTNFSVIADPMNERASEFSLYALDGSYEAIPDRARITFGRSFKTFSTIRPIVMDSVESEFYFFEKRLTTGVFTGVERKFESLGSPERKSNSVGAYASYRRSSFFPLTMTARLQHFDLVPSGAKADFTSFSVHQPLGGALSPELMANTEFQLDRGAMSRTEAGVDLYPTHRSSLGFRFLTYDLSTPVGADESIFEVFSEGRLNEASIKAGYQFSPQLSGNVGLSFDRYVIQRDRETDGRKFELGAAVSLGVFELNDFVYFLESYGGRAIGDKILINWKVTDRWKCFGLVDYVLYEKITSSKRSALNTQLGATAWLKNAFRLDIGGEFNNNNIDRDDFRFFTRLTYLLWQET